MVIRVPARFTTQQCCRCGAYVHKSLSVRTHVCPAGGLIEDRDVNAAKYILHAGIQTAVPVDVQAGGQAAGIQAGAPPSGTASRWAAG